MQDILNCLSGPPKGAATCLPAIQNESAMTKTLQVQEAVLRCIAQLAPREEGNHVIHGDAQVEAVHRLADRGAQHQTQVCGYPPAVYLRHQAKSAPPATNSNPSLIIKVARASTRTERFSTESIVRYWFQIGMVSSCAAMTMQTRISAKARLC